MSVHQGQETHNLFSVYTYYNFCITEFKIKENFMKYFVGYIYNKTKKFKAKFNTMYSLYLKLAHQFNNHNSLNNHGLLM